MAAVTIPHPMAIAFLPFFPESLFFSERFSWPALIGGWAVYVILSILLLRTADTLRYLAWMGVLCVILVLNICGCSYSFHHARIGHAI
jgi:hypothetical protein